MIRKIDEITQTSSVGGHKEDSEVGIMSTGLAQLDDRRQKYVWWFDTGEEAQNFIETASMKFPEIELYGPYAQRVPLAPVKNKSLVTLVVPATEETAESLDELVMSITGEYRRVETSEVREGFSFSKILESKLLESESEAVAEPYNGLCVKIDPKVQDDMFQELVVLVESHKLTDTVYLEKDYRLVSGEACSQVRLGVKDRSLTFKKFDDAHKFIQDLNAVLLKYDAIRSDRVVAVVRAEYTASGSNNPKVNVVFAI